MSADVGKDLTNAGEENHVARGLSEVFTDGGREMVMRVKHSLEGFAEFVLVLGKFQGEESLPASPLFEEFSREVIGVDLNDAQPVIAAKLRGHSVTRSLHLELPHSRVVIHAERHFFRETF